MVRCRDPSCKLKCGSNDHSTPECTLNERDTEPVESDPEPEDESTSWNGNDNSEDEAASELDKEKKVICRLCATSDNTCIPIFTERGMELELYIKIPKYLPVELHKDDDMPSQICTSCVTAVTAWHEFATVCTKTEMELKKRFCTRTTQNTSLFKRKLGNTENSSGSNKRMCLRSREPTKEKDDNMRTASEEEDIQTHDKSEIFIVETDNEDMHCDDNFSGGEESDCVDISRDEEKTDNIIRDADDQNTSLDASQETPSQNILLDIVAKETPSQNISHVVITKEAVNTESVVAEQTLNAENTSSETVDRGDEENYQSYEVIGCMICEIEFPTFQQLIEHNKTLHFDYPYYCNICSKLFYNEQNLKTHERKEHYFGLTSSHLINSCPVCNLTFLYPYYRKHLTTHPNFCVTCLKDYGSTETYDEHKKSHTHVLCKDCGAAVRKSKIKRHTEAHNSKILQKETSSKENKCNNCQMTFTSEEILYKHIMSEHIVVQYNKMCEICGKVYQSQRRFENHSQFAHRSVEQPYQCAECGKTYRSKKNLKCHFTNFYCISMKPYKTNDMNLQCELCGKCFKRKIGLTRHMKTHNPERPAKYVCGICDLRFKELAILKGHMLVHLAVKPYKCEFCEKSFVNKYGKENHERSQHTGERPFICEICDKSFTSKKNLYFHVRCHYKSKIYKCKYCDEVFSDKYSQIYHISKIHPKLCKPKEKKVKTQKKRIRKPKNNPGKPKKRVSGSRKKVPRSKKSINENVNVGRNVSSETHDTYLKSILHFH